MSNPSWTSSQANYPTSFGRDFSVTLSPEDLQAQVGVQWSKAEMVGTRKVERPGCLEVLCQDHGLSFHSRSECCCSCLCLVIVGI